MVPISNTYSLMRWMKNHARPDLVHTVGVLTSYYSAMCKYFLKVPVVHTIDDIHSKLPLGSVFLPLPRFVRFGCLPLLDYVTYTNDFIKNYINGAGLPLTRITKIPCGVSDVWIDKSTCPDPPRDTVLFWGDASKERGTDVFLASIPSILKEHPGVSLVMAIRCWYPPEYRKTVYGFARKFQKNITILETPYKCHVSQIVANATVVALPFRVNPREPPGTLVESLALGKGVVTTDIGGNRELIGQNERGILIEPNDQSQLSEAILSLLGDISKRKKLGKVARRFILDFYDWNKLIIQILKLYRAVKSDG